MPSFSRICLHLAAVSAISQCASAFSLQQFDPIDTLLPQLCDQIYREQIPGCDDGDFQTGGCSASCVQGIDSITEQLRIACEGAPVAASSTISIFRKGYGLTHLCPANTDLRRRDLDEVSGSMKADTEPVLGGLLIDRSPQPEPQTTITLQVIVTTTRSDHFKYTVTETPSPPPSPSPSTTPSSSPPPPPPKSSAAPPRRPNAGNRRPSPSVYVPPTTSSSASSTSTSSAPTSSATSSRDPDSNGSLDGSGGGSPFDVTAGAAPPGVQAPQPILFSLLALGLAAVGVF